MLYGRCLMSDGENQSGSESWDLSSIGEFLMSRSEGLATAAWTQALPAISQRFPPDVWVVNQSVNPYGPGAHSNLYLVESRQDFRGWLQAQSVSVDDYAAAVGPIQYVSVQLHLNSLMPRARANRGWRIRLMGFPPVGVIALGLASHYQGTQNQNEMGAASALIRSRALEVLTGDAKHELEDWPAATAEDWERRGLMDSPALSIGDLDISGFDEGRGAMLRMIRNTTVKKELATFFAIKGLSESEFLQGGAEYVTSLKKIALALGSPEVP